MSYHEQDPIVVTNFSIFYRLLPNQIQEERSRKWKVDYYIPHWNSLMKSNPIYSPFTALTLKTVGLVMIVSSLLDYILLAIPFKPTNQQWQLMFTTQIVDRGIIPMVGIGFLVTGYWVANSMGAGSTEPRSSVQDLRFWAFLLASLLGLIFLLLAPLHFNNIRLQSSRALQQIEQQANQKETQLETQAEQFNALLKNPDQLSKVEQRLDQQLEQATKSGQVPADQLAAAQQFRQQLQLLKENPDTLGKRVEEGQTKIRSLKLEAQQQARTEVLKLGLKTGLTSLLLAIGYIVIGWVGLRNIATRY